MSLKGLSRAKCKDSPVVRTVCLLLLSVLATCHVPVVCSCDSSCCVSLQLATCLLSVLATLLVVCSCNLPCGCLHKMRSVQYRLSLLTRSCTVFTVFSAGGRWESAATALSDCDKAELQSAMGQFMKQRQQQAKQKRLSPKQKVVLTGLQKAAAHNGKVGCFWC